MQNPLLSIIIPLYNKEKYIEDCIHSVNNQNFKDFEIIIIDDGSTDKSNEIVSKLCVTDSKIKLISVLNGGLSYARNIGLANATGKYIYFVDSDDTMKPDVLSIMMDIMEKNQLDIGIFNADVISETQHDYIKENLKQSIMNGEQMLVHMASLKYIYAPVWLYVYKRDVIENLRFKEGFIHEDEDWTPRILLKSKRIKYTNLKVYNYFIRQDSIMNQKKKNNRSYENISVILKDLNELLYSKISNKKSQKILRDYVARQYMSITRLYYGDLKEYKKLIDYKYIRKNIKTIKTYLKYLIFRYNLKLYIRLTNR